MIPADHMYCWRDQVSLDGLGYLYGQVSLAESLLPDVVLTVAAAVAAEGVAVTVILFAVVADDIAVDEGEGDGMGIAPTVHGIL